MLAQVWQDNSRLLVKDLADYHSMAPKEVVAALHQYKQAHPEQTPHMYRWMCGDSFWQMVCHLALMLTIVPHCTSACWGSCCVFSSFSHYHHHDCCHCFHHVTYMDLNCLCYKLTAVHMAAWSSRRLAHQVQCMWQHDQQTLFSWRPGLLKYLVGRCVWHDVS